MDNIYSTRAIICTSFPNHQSAGAIPKVYLIKFAGCSRGRTATPSGGEVNIEELKGSPVAPADLFLTPAYSRPSLKATCWVKVGAIRGGIALRNRTNSQGNWIVEKERGVRAVGGPDKRVSWRRRLYDSRGKSDEGHQQDTDIHISDSVMTRINILM